MKITHIDFILILLGIEGWLIIAVFFHLDLIAKSRIEFSEYAVIVFASMLIIAVFRLTRFIYDD